MVVKEDVRSNVFVFGCVFLATLFGKYAQSIALYMSENIARIDPIYYLAALTIASVLLYVVAFAFTMKREKPGAYLLIIGIIGVPISIQALSVLATWWG